MPRNALLLRWKNGFAERTDPVSVATWSRQEGFLSVATVDSAPSAEAQGDTALAAWSNPQTSITARYQPTGTGDLPYTDINPGEALTCPDINSSPTAYRVEAFTVTEDDDGELTYTPELLSLAESERRRQQNWLARIGQGTLGGRSSSATLLETVTPDTNGGRISTRDVVFSKGVLEVGQSPPLLVAKSSRLTMVQATVLPGATSPAISFRILLNGTALSFATPGGSPATSFSLTPSAARLVLLPSAGDVVVAESDIVAIDLQSVAADAELFGLTATLADLF